MIKFPHYQHHIRRYHLQHYLLINDEGAEFDNFLDRKIRKLKDKWNHLATDDLAIIRLISTHKNNI